MSKFTANPLPFNTEPEAFSAFFNNVSNLSTIMPEQVQDWQSDENTCSFFIQNLGQLSMQKGTFNFPDSYSFQSTENSKVRFTLSFHFHPDDEVSPTGFFALDADMNPMVEMLAKRPLSNFVNILTENLQEKMLKNT
jgi:hypothetical protein